MIDDLGFPGDDDDYFDTFADDGLSPTGRFRYPPHKVALGRGWSMLVGNSANHLVPRGGAPWTDAEERDLLAAAARCTDLSVLATAHGRTETAIACRLEQLGYDRGALAAMDFADVELRVLAQVVGPTTKQQGAKKKMKMTANRLMALLALYRGTYTNELKVGTSGPDLAHLVAEGLATVGHGDRQPDLTDDGRALVEAVLGKTSTSGGSASTSWVSERNTSTLDDQRFFLVASGDCMKGGPHGKPQLKKPPVTVQSSCRDAEREAQRLAGANRGEKFFVLQAVSVHEVQPAPATSRRL